MCPRKQVGRSKPRNPRPDDRNPHRTAIRTPPNVGWKVRTLPSRMEQAVSIGTVRERTSRISQVVTLVAVAVPALGLAAAMGALWDIAFHWSDLAIMGGMYILCAFGTTI